MKKAKVEFYFILYLAAIATLFAIASQRDLQYKILKEMIMEGGPPQVQIDIPKIPDYNVDDVSSINLGLNELFSIKNVDKIKDPLLRIVKVTKNNVDVFNLSEFITNKFTTIDNSSLKFNGWLPSGADTGKYCITFKASGIPKRSAKVDSLLNELPDEELKTQLKDTTVFADLNFNITKKTKKDDFLPEIALSIYENPVKSIVIKRSTGNNINLGWINRIFASGVPTPLSYLKIGPSNGNINIRPDPNDKNTFILSGQCDERFEVTVDFNTPVQPKHQSFTVEPIIGEFYENSKTAYSGDNYEFKGGFSNLNITVEVEYLVDGNPVPNNIGQNRIEIKDISSSLEGHKLTFIRKYQGMNVGDAVNVEIKPPREPQIVSHQFKGEVLEITTRAYGKTKDRKSNVPDQLFFMKGGAETTVTGGEISSNPSENYCERTFKIVKNSNIKIIVPLKLKIKDKRGGESSPPKEIDF